MEEAAVGRANDGLCGQALDPSHDRDHHFHKRCQHYRHKHGYHGGKAGNAQLAVRAMIDAQGATEFDATTGSFDDGSSAPGSFDQIVVDVSTPNGRRQNEVKFKPHSAGGYFSSGLGKLAHGALISVDATITGIDPKPDRVTVTDQIRYRPDLAVSHIDVPRSAAIGLPTSISATVIERMGDMGAKADCLLSADGAVVDRASGIWVDAGSAVTCHFSYTFSTAGQHAVHVAITNVQPGDYDATNNSADATVVVTPQFAFSATASDATYSGIDTAQVVDGRGNVLYNENDTWGGSLQSASVTGGWAMGVTFPLASLVATASSGGSAWSLVAATNLAATASDPTQGTCAAASDDSTYNWVTVCSTTSNGAPATTISVSEFAGDVTYHSDGACIQTSALYDCQGGYTWNTDTSSQWAVRQPLNGSLAVNVSLSDASGNVLQGVATVPLAGYTSQYNVPQVCDPQPDQTQYCHSHQYLEMGVQGSVGQ